MTTGAEAQAYASYITATSRASPTAPPTPSWAPEREAKAAVTAAKDSGASADEVATLQAKATAITDQRDTLFKGETLRGLLLASYAWETVGRVAGIAAVAAFVGAGRDGRAGGPRRGPLPQDPQSPDTRSSEATMPDGSAARHRRVPNAPITVHPMRAAGQAEAGATPKSTTSTTRTPAADEAIKWLCALVVRYCRGEPVHPQHRPMTGVDDRGAPDCRVGPSTASTVENRYSRSERRARRGRCAS